MARTNADDASRLVTKGDLRDFKSDIRREVALMIAAGSTLSGLVAGYVAKAPHQAPSTAMHVLHFLL
jgi:hypothetical protein